MADAAGNQCMVCGCKAVIMHDGLLVCEECGTINKEDMITLEHQDAEGYQAASENNWIMHDNNKKFSNRTKIPDGKTRALSQIKIYGRLLNFTPNMMAQAEHMFSVLFADEEIIKKSIQNKVYLAYGCLYVVGRTNGLTVSLKEFTKLTSIPLHKLVNLLKLITRKLSIEIPSKTVTEITIEITTIHKIHKDIIPTALEILSICDRAWLVTGRIPQKFAWSSIYIALKALHMDEYKKVTYSKFLKKYMINYNCTDDEHLKEVLKVLTELGDHIPWAMNKGKKDFVYCNLSDILRYSKMALMEKKMKLVKSMETELGHESNSYNGKRKVDDEVADHTDIYQPPVLKHAKLSTNREEVLNDLPVTYYDCDIENLGSEIDAELDEYIRSEAEVSEIKKARALIIDKENS